MSSAPKSTKGVSIARASSPGHPDRLAIMCIDDQAIVMAFHSVREREGYIHGALSIGVRLLEGPTSGAGVSTMFFEEEPPLERVREPASRGLHRGPRKRCTI